MEKFFCNDIIGQCCKRIPEYLVRFNGTSCYSVLICKFHLNKKPYGPQNIVLIKDLDSIELVIEPKEEINDA